MGPYQALRAGSLLVLPAARRWRSRMRAVKCPATDPVSFALVDGGPAASFPDVSGWSAGDTARRAVAERRASLREKSSRGRGEQLGDLLACARASLFLESVEAGDPELPLTAAATTSALAARSSAARSVAEEALGAFRAFAGDGSGPSEATVAALRRVVMELPGYA